MKVAVWSARMTGYAGVELYTRDLAIGLARAGNQVAVHAGSWEDHYKIPLTKIGIACREFECDDSMDVNVSPKGAPLKAASFSQKPILQVLHSEHLSDIPTHHHLLRGFVLIRSGQRFLLEQAGPWALETPHRVIRNPIDYSRLDAEYGKHHVPAPSDQWACLMVSEFDEQKAELAAEVRARVDGDVGLLGKWMTDRPVPDGCRLIHATLGIGGAYYCSRMAFSYRLSRQVPEAAYCETSILVRGQLEPSLVTRHDRDDEWLTLKPSDVNLDEFRCELVAQRITEFARSVL